MDIIFKGRRTDVQERFREHAAGKLGKIERLDRRATRVDVEVSQERNPRLAGQRERVELTIRSRGPVVRAEAAADDRYAALDLALAKLETRLRRSADRRKAAKRPGNGPVRSGAQTQPAVGAQTPVGREAAQIAQGAAPDIESVAPDSEDVVPIQMEGEGPVVVREKSHAGSPMSVSDALFQMELVGHDFYLFRDEESGHPSVVYRRRGYQYGLIRLVEGKEMAAGSQTAGGGVAGSGRDAVAASGAAEDGRAGGAARQAVDGALAGPGWAHASFGTAATGWTG